MIMARKKKRTISQGAQPLVRGLSREPVCPLCRRIDQIERELAELRKQLTETACNHAGAEDGVPRNQCPAFRPPRQDGSKRKTLKQRVLDEL